ncbi:putative tail fiber protein [Bacillus phage vB_BspM_AgentSmith]|nr:putative tail fiber protein [Bacillus phage vB_BspM_AgentSmith]
MRIKTHRQGGHESGGLSLGGGKMAGPLTLFRDPIEELEAVTKQYVDTLGTRLDASSIKTGILPDRLLGGWQGDVTTDVGSRVTTVGGVVTPGEYTSVEVSDTGRVVDGGLITANDVPGLDWTKFTKDMPSDLAGYGITDGISTRGDTLEGYLILEDHPSIDNEISSKQHTDSLFPIEDKDRVKVGDVIRKTTDVTPPGFLKCNGSIVDKTMYANLYASVGNKFNNNISKGNGTPWFQQYEINSEPTTPTFNWTVGSSMPVSGGGARSNILVTKNRVYILGNTASSAILSAPILPNGDVGTWTVVGDINYINPITSKKQTMWYSSGVVVYNNVVYLIGGGGFNFACFKATINPDGTIGSFTLLPNPLIEVNRNFSHFVLGNKIYVVGGYKDTLPGLDSLPGGHVYNTYSCYINTDGSLTPWTLEPHLVCPPENSPERGIAVVTKNRVYMVGLESLNSKNVLMSEIKEDLSLTPWVILKDYLPQKIVECRGVVTNKSVYLFGGANHTTSPSVLSNDINKATINLDGTLSKFETIGQVPSLPFTDSRSIIVNNKLHLFGMKDSEDLNYITMSTPFPGGSNDYSEYYNGSHLNLVYSNKFTLPNLNFQTNNQYNYYIKY